LEKPVAFSFQRSAECGKVRENKPGKMVGEMENEQTGRDFTQTRMAENQA